MPPGGYTSWCRRISTTLRDSSEAFEVTRPGLRLDKSLAEALGCGRREARRLIAAGCVSVGGRRLTAANRLPLGAHVVVEAIESNQPPPPPAAVTVLWRGQEMLALYKAAGVHSESGHGGLTVAAFLEAEVPGALTVGQREAEAGLVHRLDRDTSGVILAATTATSYQRLRDMFAGATVEKTYLALVEGSVQRRFQVDIPLARRRTRVVRATRRDRSMQALTQVYPLLVRSSWSLVSVVIRTGVTHQVRAHLAMSGHPVIGDGKYCAPPAPPATRQGQLLHAATVALPGGPQFSAAVPVDFVKAYAALLGPARS